MIPQCDPGAGYLAQRADIDTAIARVLASGWFILGSEVKAFEEEFATFIGTPHALGVANGTDALELALRALDIGPGDDVLTVSFTAVATVAAIGRSGARARFIDIDPNTLTLCPDALQDFLQAPQTRLPKAIIVVHLYGQPAQMERINSIAAHYGISVIEDCAQAHGASIAGHKVGSLSTIGCFSMYPTKNLGALGDAGAIVTHDPLLHEKMAQLRQYGWEQRFISAIPGINSRLDEIQAAVLRVRLPQLEQDNRKRQRLAAIYDRCLAQTSLTLPTPSEGSQHVYHQYAIRSDARQQLISQLRQQQIHCAVHYPAAVHQQPAYQRWATESPPLPHTEAATASVMSLPMYPQLSPEDADFVGQTLAHLSP